MKTKFFLFLCCLLFASVAYGAKDKEVVPPVESNWDKNVDGNRSLSQSPSLFKDSNFIYVYSEKQLDNLYIGITDMMGNVYHYEVTTVPAGMYYAVSIELLPVGQYYLSVYQGSNYVIGMFIKE